MTDYIPLTKIIKQDDKEFVVCKFYGTQECRSIHTPNAGCACCPMMAAILNQLHAFETCYMESEGEIENGRR